MNPTNTPECCSRCQKVEGEGFDMVARCQEPDCPNCHQPDMKQVKKLDEEKFARDKENGTRIWAGIDPVEYEKGMRSQDTEWEAIRKQAGHILDTIDEKPYSDSRADIVELVQFALSRHNCLPRTEVAKVIDSMETPLEIGSEKNPRWAYQRALSDLKDRLEI